ncbi:hypothetical protein BKH28_10445 [Actinomyces oris]|uniref:Uncharacterized protein n=1 Tax=Actinomyces oris TaxID=544580 RepID=A0A1Q8VJZ8_9ACTO|nr:hypothetical protein BKH28_10445 [Actinomyces oris]
MARAKVDPAVISSVTPSAVTRICPVGPSKSHHVASLSSRPAKNAESLSPNRSEDPIAWAITTPHHRHSNPATAETVSAKTAKAQRAAGSIPGVVAAMASRRVSITWAAVSRPSIMRWGRVMRQSV